MGNLLLQVGSRSAQGLRPNNEDRLVVDLQQNLFLVADGMGGQEHGEVASGLAAEIIPKIVRESLTAIEDAAHALRRALAVANAAIIDWGGNEPAGRRMGTTAVLALCHANQVFIAGVGDSRAYLIRGSEVDQLTVDDSLAQAMVASGELSAEEARQSRYQHVLCSYLGCPGMIASPRVYSFAPCRGDRLLLATDGLTNRIEEKDLSEGSQHFASPQAWADFLVQTALHRGSRDNITCVVVDFEAVP